MISRPQYTEMQIHDLSNDLPGFAEPADAYQVLEGMIAHHSLWQPVLSTTIVSRLGGELHVLTGKRTASGNTTHVNIASTPTMRVSPQEAGLLLAENVPFCLSGTVNPSRPFKSESLTPSVAHVPNSTDVLSAKVGNLLSLKLGLGSALEEARSPIGRCSLARCIVGFSYVDNDSSGEPLYEPLMMLGAIVGLDQEVASQIPSETSSYGNLGWAAIDRYVHGVATKTLLEVIPGANAEDELGVCVRGLCNATSSTILADSGEIQYHLTEQGVLPRI